NAHTMQLGFVSAILGDLSLEEVFKFAAAEGFKCVELMCWPQGGASRRYAGVSHVDVTSLDDAAARQVRALSERYGVAISGLGYYPNPLDPDAEARRTVADHLMNVIRAAARLDLRVVNTFIGRDPQQSPDATWAMVREVWPPILRCAESEGVKLAIENC